jgi:CheY-like chemotaxis protein
MQAINLLTPPSQKRILITEDDDMVRQTIKLLLAADDYAVTEARTGEEALVLLNRERFDLVITDFEMPGLRGDELAGIIKRQLPSQPILMVTAYVERLGDCDNPVDAVLAKPFRIQDLRKAMAKLLGAQPFKALGGLDEAVANSQSCAAMSPEQAKANPAKITRVANLLPELVDET